MGNEAVDLSLKLAIRFEGIYLKPYLDPAGIPTQGIGCRFHPDGRLVSLGDPPITRSQAIDWCVIVLEREVIPAVIQLCPTADTPSKLGALADFTFNLGASRFRASTLRQRALERNWSAAAVELNKWIFARGQSLPGLKMRRAAEGALLLS